MANDGELKKLLAALGLAHLDVKVPTALVREMESLLASVGAIDVLRTGDVPPPPPPQPNPAFGTPEPPIAAGQITYGCWDVPDDGPVPPVRVSTRADTIDGTPVWRAEVRIVDGEYPLEEDVVLRASDLRLMLYEGRVPLMAWFRFTVRGEYVHTQTSVGSDPPPMRLPESAFPTLPSLWAALAAAPLERGWSTTVQLFQKVTEDDWRYLPLRLEVVGEELVESVLGWSDCWIVSARGTVGDRVVDDRYWVTRGDPATRVVLRAHEGRRNGATRHYHLVELRRPTTASETPPGPASSPSASFELQYDRSARKAREPIVLRRGGQGRLSAAEIAERVAERMKQVPSIDELRAAGRIPPGTPPEAVDRYMRERVEYEEDLRARFELNNALNDHSERHKTLTAIVRVESDQPKATYLRLAVPSRVQIEFDEGYHIDDARGPVALTAPLHLTRKRYVARIHTTRERSEGAQLRQKFVAPDGSNVVVVGPVPTSRESWMIFDLTFRFARWEDVFPFTLTYDISVEGTEPVAGSVEVQMRVVDWKPPR